MGVPGWEHLPPSEVYRRRFESSVLGQHQLFPPTVDGKKDFIESCAFEKPKQYPSGPNTSFADPTPMPFRFQDGALPAHNARFAANKPQHPCFETSSADIGKLGCAHVVESGAEAATWVDWGLGLGSGSWSRLW